MDEFVVDSVARKNIARFQALLRTQIEDVERRGLLRLMAQEQRKLLQREYESAQEA